MTTQSTTSRMRLRTLGTEAPLSSSGSLCRWAIFGLVALLAGCAVGTAAEVANTQVVRKIDVSTQLAKVSKEHA